MVAGVTESGASLRNEGRKAERGLRIAFAGVGVEVEASSRTCGLDMRATAAEVACFEVDASARNRDESRGKKEVEVGDPSRHRFT